MIRYFALGLVLSCAMVATQFYFKDEIANLTNSENPTLVSPAVNEYPTSSKTEDSTATSNNKSDVSDSAIASPQAPQTPEADHSTDQNTNSQLPQEDELWLSDTNDRPIPARYQRNGLLPEPLKINQKQVKKLKFGDEVSLSIPQTGQAYDMKVKRVTKHQNGTRTLTAEITNTPVPYSVVVTGGAVTTFATINTPEGTYSLDASGDDAWLVAQLDLDQLIDPNLPDYQIPEMHQ